MTSIFEGRHIDLRRATHRSSKVDTSIIDLRKSTHRSSKIEGGNITPTRGVGTGGATGARAPLVLQQAKLTYKAYVGLSLRDPVGSADHMAQGVCDAIGIATQYSYIIVRHYLEL